MAGEMMEKIEEVKADTVVTEDDIDLKTKDKEIHIRKWWMVPVVIGTLVVGVMAIIVTLVYSGALDSIVSIFGK